MASYGHKAYFMAYILIGIGILIALAFVGIVLYLIFDFMRNRLSPRQRAAAVVARKNHRQHDTSIGAFEPNLSLRVVDELLGDGSGDVLVHQSADCYITFVFNGYSKEFKVPQKIWVNLTEGDEGLLIYQGDLFRKFIVGVKDSW